MGEFASKGVAGAGLGLGIAGTALGVLNSGGLGGLLGGVLGGGNAAGAALGVLAEKDAEIAKLKAENYSDKVGKEVYSQSLSDNRATEQRINAILGPTATAIAENQKDIAVLKAEFKSEQEKAVLREQIMQSKIDNCCCQMGSRIDAVAQAATCGIQQNSAALAALQAAVGKITTVVIPKDAICPEVMLRYNSWTAPTAQAPDTQSVSGSVNSN